MGSLSRALGVVGFIRDLVFTCVFPGLWVHSLSQCECVHPGSLGSLANALGVIGFVRGRSVHSRAPWGPLGSSRVLEFTCARSRGHWVHAASLGSLSCVLVVVGFIWARWIHSREPLGSLDSSEVIAITDVQPWFLLVLPGTLGAIGFMQCRWVHSGAPLGSLGSVGVVSFCRVCLGAGWAHLGSRLSFG